MDRARIARGFSLLEVLVTVTLFALLFAVLMGGWYQALQAQARLDVAAQRLQQQQQLQFALRQLLAGILSPRADQGTLFSGDRRGLVAESTAALMPAMERTPLRVSLRIKGGGQELKIELEHPGQPAVTYPWSLQAAEFRYLDAAGRAHDQWPPQYSFADRPGAVPPLPALIQLTLQFDGQPQPATLFVAPRASPWPPVERTTPFALPMN
jgi:prepilin-type N-terminal cleavage/methylation domain-containing protein